MVIRTIIKSLLYKYDIISYFKLSTLPEDLNLNGHKKNIYTHLGSYPFESLQDFYGFYLNAKGNMPWSMRSEHIGVIKAEAAGFEKMIIDSGLAVNTTGVHLGIEKRLEAIPLPGFSDFEEIGLFYGESAPRDNFYLLQPGMQTQMSYAYFNHYMQIAPMPLILPRGTDKHSFSDEGDIRTVLLNYYLHKLDLPEDSGRWSRRQASVISICGGFARFGEEVVRALTDRLKLKLKEADVPLTSVGLPREKQLTPGNLQAGTLLRLFWMDMANRHGQGSFYDRPAN